MKETDLSAKKLFLLDMDGTLYLDDCLFEGTMPFLSGVRERGGRVIYLTNNSSRSVDAYIRKMDKFGIRTSPEDFVTSVDATVDYLRDHWDGALLYVLGTQSFLDQLSAAGLQVTTDRRENVECLVMGFDTELTFPKLRDASELLRRDIGYVAANPDLVCPTSFGYVPDCGSVAQMLKNATGREPVFIGKPAPAMIEFAMRRANASPDETVLIGDRIYTDIASGVRAGIDTVMVLSGEGTVEELSSFDFRPTWIFDDIGCVASVLRGEKK